MDNKGLIGHMYNDCKGKGEAVLVSGATGFLGQSIVEKLSKRNDIKTINCIVRDREKAESIFVENKKVEIITIEDVRLGLVDLSENRVFIHCAFALIYYGLEAIANSLEFSNWILNEASQSGIPSIINISTQSVYGFSRKPLWHEDLAPIPESPYGVAKFATELIASNINRNNKSISTTSVRLPRLFGPGQKNFELPYKFTELVCKNEDIVIRGGKQNLDLIDVRDAADGVISLLDISQTEWKSVYNIGTGGAANIKDIANAVNIAANGLGMEGSRIVVVPEDIDLDYGMDISRIIKDTGWFPKIKLVETFTDIINCFNENND